MGANRIVVVTALAAILGACDSRPPTAAPIAAVEVGCLGEPSVSPPVIRMSVGDTAVVSIHVPTCTGLGSSVTWTSSDKAVASVDSAKGVVRALAVGLASVTAKLVSDPTVSASAVVQVSAR
jgi:hypothetical protein